MPTKEYILSLNEGKPTAERFIIQDLDDTRLFVQPTVVEWLQKRLKEFQEEVRGAAAGGLYVRRLFTTLFSSVSVRRLLQCRTPTSRPAARTRPNRERLNSTLQGGAAV